VSKNWCVTPFEGIYYIDLGPLQATWVKMILNGGVDPDTNETIIPPAQFDVITSPHSIISPNISWPVSTLLYGLGWIRYSLEGYDVCEICLVLFL
jgi:hypothetical protein